MGGHWRHSFRGRPDDSDTRIEAGAYARGHLTDLRSAPDWKIAQIETSGATDEDLMLALTWAQGQDNVAIPAHPTLTGLAASVFEILHAAAKTFG